MLIMNINCILFIYFLFYLGLVSPSTGVYVNIILFIISNYLDDILLILKPNIHYATFVANKMLHTTQFIQESMELATCCMK